MTPQKKYVQARIQPDLYKKLQFYCVENETSIQEVVESLIKQLVDKEEKDAAKVMIEIDVNNDFDGGDLEEAIRRETSGQNKDILKLIHHKWVTEIGHPEWSFINNRKKKYLNEEGS